MKYKFIVYLQFINSFEGLGMFFSSATHIHWLCRHAAAAYEGENGRKSVDFPPNVGVFL